MAKTTLNLDPKNDQLVPIEALVNFSDDYLVEDALKKNKNSYEKLKAFFLKMKKKRRKLPLCIIL